MLKQLLAEELMEPVIVQRIQLEAATPSELVELDLKTVTPSNLH